MSIIPSFEDFEEQYENSNNQVLFKRLAADLDTPVSIIMKLTAMQKNSFVLESVTGGEVRGRYSMIGMKPDLIWKCKDKESFLNRNARFDDDDFILI